MKAVISKSQFNRIKNFINETKEIKKDEVLGEKKKLTKKQLDTFDVDNDGDIEADDMADLRNMRKISEKKSFPDLTGDGKVTRADILKGRGVELDESDCGCGGSEEPNDTRYMFFSNLEQMMRQARMLLQMDEDMLEDLLNNGHDWAADHIAEAKNNMDQVFDFIMGEMNGQGEDDSWGDEEEDEEIMYEDDTLGSPEDARLKNPTYLNPERKKEFVISKLSNDDFAEYFKAKALGKENEFLRKRGFDNSLNTNLPSVNEGDGYDNIYVQYDSERQGEDPFMLRGERWQFVNAIYPDGKRDIGVYKFGEDRVYSYDWFRRNIVGDKTSLNEGMKLNKKAFISKELKHHLDKNIPLYETEFRFGSEKHIELLKEVKELYNKGVISLNETDEFMINEFDPKPIKVKGVGEVYLGLIQEEYESDEQLLSEAVYQGRKVQLGKAFLTPDGPKKRSVYVRNDKGNVVKVNFGQKGVKIKKNNPARRKSFRARHNCANPGPRWKARYWSCRFW